MNDNHSHITFHPALVSLIEAEVELEETRCRAAVVLGPEVFRRVSKIVEAERSDKRAAFYETIAEAACAGNDFSRVETIRDIGEIYAQFIIKRAFGGESI